LEKEKKNPDNGWFRWAT